MDKMPQQTTLKSVDALIGEKCRTLYTHWEKLRGERMAPRRKEFTLALVGQLSSWMWTADVIDDGADFRFRLIGDHITQFIEKAYTGMLLSELPSNLFFERVRQTITCCVKNMEPVAASSTHSSYENKDHWETEAVMLPLSENGEKVTSVMGILEFWPIGS